MNKYISAYSQQFFAFNIWSIESAKAIMDAAAHAGCGVILQTSMKAFEQLDKEELRAYVKSYGRKNKIETYLHLDHCRKLDYISKAIDCGWDSVMIDASEKPLDENIKITNEVIEKAKPKGILVEAEVGQICGQEDEIYSVAEGIASMADIEKFIRNTDVDMIAAAIGTAHGLYKGVPIIHYDIIEQTSEITDIPFVIHGGTGLDDATLLKIMSYKNVKKINISTDVKLAYRNGIEEGIHKGIMVVNGFDPLKMNKLIHDSIQEMAMDKLRLLEKRKAL